MLPRSSLPLVAFCEAQRGSIAKQEQGKGLLTVNCTFHMHSPHTVDFLEGFLYQLELKERDTVWSDIVPT